MSEMLLLVRSFDTAVLEQLYAARTDVLLAIFNAISFVGSLEGILIVAAVSVIVLIVYRRYAYARMLTLGLATTALLVFGGKYLFERARPPLEYQAVFETGFAFPSAHAAFAAMLYGFIALLVWRSSLSLRMRLLLCLPLDAVVLLVAFSRLFLGVHWVSDVVVGVVIGSMSALFMYHLAQLQRSTYGASDALKSVSVMLAAVFGMGVLGAGLFFGIKGSMSSGEYLESDGLSQLVLYSERIPLLEPHQHTDLDSILFDNHGEIVGLRKGAFTTDRDMWVTSIAWDVENAPIETLHHFAFTREDKPALLCPNGFSDKEEILVVGSDTSAYKLPFLEDRAIFIPRGTPLDLETILHNPLYPFGPGGTYTNVRVKLTLTFDTDNKHTPITLVRLSNEDPACTSSSSTFDVPANTSSFTKKTNTPISSYTFQERASLFMIGAHLHGWDRGEKIVTYLNGKELETFIPKQDPKKPWLWITPTKFMERRMEPGDTITLTTTYSNPHDEPLRHEAMGMIVIGFTDDSLVP
jgi:undecaprenyl-diphosphatase